MKKSHQLLGPKSPDPLPGALSLDPTGGTAPDPHSCPPTLNDPPLPVEHSVNSRLS